MSMIKNLINWIWGWSLFAEAYFWQFLLNHLPEGKIQAWMAARSFRTAIAGAELLTDHTFLDWLGKANEKDKAS